MTRHLPRLTSLALAVALGPAALPVRAEDVAIPRAEYEQLHHEMQSLRLRLEQVESRNHFTPQEREYLRMQLEAAATGESGNGLTLDASRFTPGWERVRHVNWMDHGKLEEMNVRIGRAGPLDLYMGLHTAGRLQYLDHRDVSIGGTERRSLEPGFQTAWGSFEFLTDIDDGALEVYFDVYISSKPHPNNPQGHEGYMLIRRLPGMEDGLAADVMNVIDIKAGQFEIDFGDHRYRRSDNARVQRNPLVGNYVVDPNTTEVGMEVFSAQPLPLVPIHWLVGFGSGAESGGFANGRGMSSHAKLWADLTEELRLSGSAYHVHHAPASGARSNLFRTSRSGGSYGGVFDDGNAPGEVFLGGGQKVLALQGDLSWIGERIELYGHGGWARDDNAAGPAFGEDEWIYYAAEGVYRFTPRFYAAARYSGAAAQQLQGERSDGHVHRVQAGIGYWLFSTVLVKAEYVHQFYRGFDTAGGRVSGVDAWRDPSFHGIIMEVSFSF